MNRKELEKEMFQSLLFMDVALEDFHLNFSAMEVWVSILVVMDVALEEWIKI